MENPQKRLQFRFLSGQMLPQKNALRLCLAISKPSGPGFAFRSFAFKNAVVCDCVVKP